MLSADLEAVRHHRPCLHHGRSESGRKEVKHCRLQHLPLLLNSDHVSSSSVTPAYPHCTVRTLRTCQFPKGVKCRPGENEQNQTKLIEKKEEPGAQCRTVWAALAVGGIGRFSSIDSLSRLGVRQLTSEYNSATPSSVSGGQSTRRAAMERMELEMGTGLAIVGTC